VRIPPSRQLAGWIHPGRGPATTSTYGSSGLCSSATVSSLLGHRLCCPRSWRFRGRATITWRRCAWRNERSTWPVLSRAYRAVLAVLTSGPSQRPVKVTALQFDPPSQHPLAPIFTKETVPQATRFAGAPPSGGRNDEPHACGRAILNSEALRLEIRSDSSVLLELQRRGRHLVMSTSCPCRSRPQFS
jgi:hypothetical protein